VNRSKSRSGVADEEKAIDKDGRLSKGGLVNRQRRNWGYGIWEKGGI
jgi:hypothetical protein